jgi:protein-tyrosine phosphatase
MTKQLLKELDFRMSVESAGMQKYIGRPLRSEILDIAKKHGIDLSMHVPRQVDLCLINQSDLNLVFENSQVTELEERFPNSKDKTYTISNYSGYNDAYGSEDLRNKPVEMYEKFFKETRTHIKKCLERMINQKTIKERI